MKNYVISLTSQQVLGAPDCINGYLFLDPVYGSDISYPDTDDGGNFSFSNNYTLSADDGKFFPWGYIFQDTVESLTAGIFKGPYTITFNPSALDTEYYSTLKIIYDFDDGGEPLIVERSVIQNTNALIPTLNSGPAAIPVTYDYWPRNSTTTTYRPSVSVVNGNLAQNIYHYQFTFVPISLFDLNSFHLINTAQHTNALDETFSIFELDQPEYVTNARFFSGGKHTTYNDSSLLDTIDYNEIPGLILNLDAADALTITKNGDNLVSYWRDKSSYGNDFSQESIPLRPRYLYDTQSQSNRKCVYFSFYGDNTVDECPYMACINSTGFNSITGGYTAFYVTKANILIGTIFSGGVSQTMPNNLLFKFLHQNGIGVYQSLTGIDITDITYVLPGYSLYTVTAQASAALDVSADNLTFNYRKTNFLYFEDVSSPASISLPTNPYETDFELSQILIYNRALNAEEYNTVYSSLVAKWGITLRED